MEIQGLESLLLGTHEVVARRDDLCSLMVVNLEQQALMSHLCVPLLGHFVTRDAELYKLLDLHLYHLWCRLSKGFFGFLDSSLGQDTLMFLPLDMEQVSPVIVMQSQTEFALRGSQVVLHKIWVLVEVYGLQGQLPQALSLVQVAL